MSTLNPQSFDRLMYSDLHFRIPYAGCILLENGHNAYFMSIHFVHDDGFAWLASWIGISIRVNLVVFQIWSRCSLGILNSRHMPCVHSDTLFSKPAGFFCVCDRSLNPNTRRIQMFVHSMINSS